MESVSNSNVSFSEASGVFALFSDLSLLVLVGSTVAGRCPYLAFASSQLI